MPQPDLTSLRFRATDEDEPGPLWQRRVRSLWRSYRPWFLSEGDQARPGFLECREKLREYMPELLPTWERLVDLGGGGDQLARMLSLYCPPPYLAGCSQGLWPDGDPVLVRNYDFHPTLCEAEIVRTAWRGPGVIAMSDSIWGALDGINEAGLAVSLAFGGRHVIGVGFGIPLILRYILETCEDTEGACDVLRRVPSHMSYNIAILDAAGGHATVQVAPDLHAVVLPTRVSTNHQSEEPPIRKGPGAKRRQEEFARSKRRAAALDELLAEGCVEDGISPVDAFLNPPLFQTDYRRASGTLYTAAYWPRQRRVSYHWQNVEWSLPIDRFSPGEVVIHYA